MPACSSFSLMSRIGEIRTCSLWRKFVGIAVYSKKIIKPLDPVDQCALTLHPIIGIIRHLCKQIFIGSGFYRALREGIVSGYEFSPDGLTYV